MSVARAGTIAALLMSVGAVAGAADQPGARSAASDPTRDARSVAARVDAALEARWAEAGVRPVERADDAEFLRRVSLDLIGKIPTAAEARDFLDDPRAEKRATVVERLLDGPAYIGRAAEIWREVLLPEADTDDQARLAAGPFEAWLRHRVEEDAGYDRIAREILTARLDADGGDPAGMRAGPSPAAYYLAKGRRPENLAAGTARVFLGIRLECAQCHNHPFAAWKREQFWGFAAFFAGVAPDEPGQGQARRREAAARRELTIPGTATIVKAAHLDGTEPAWRPRGDAREALADWITGPENPRFARAVANRVWARFFGMGLVEPVDDIDGQADAPLAGLLDELAREFRDHGYDLKFLVRVVTATRAYHLSSAVEPGGVTPPPLFACMPARGLSSGQLLESLARATGRDTAEARARLMELFSGRDERPIEAQATILQALALMNGDYIASATDPGADGLLGAVAEAPYLDTAGRIETLYLSALTRRPRPDDWERLVRYVEGRESPEARARALGDVFWAILNGPEFRLNH